ncbi:MAG TPA: hypothetical protein DHW82_12660 [Spirochaetia bacterium]|nr:hypothetical protein [Spirochaetia bacterium]
MDNDLENIDNILKQLNQADSAFNHYETKIMKLKNLLEVTKIINSTLEEDKLAQIILYSCQGQFLVQNATLILLEDTDKGLFEDHLSIGLEKDKFEVKITKDSPLLKAFYSNPDDESKNLGKKAYFYSEIKKFFQNQGLDALETDVFMPDVLAPLWGKNSLYGFLILGKKLDSTSFEREDLSYIFQFTELAAISIENAKLFEMAIMDRMTRLYNHQYFKNRLYEEMERSKRYQRTVSLMFFDIDHFKSFNDTYGHQQGDIVLKATSGLIKTTVRKTDIPARYGGEEFAVILPETSVEEAFKVGEKIRKRIEAFEYPGQEKPLHVNISCGIAEFKATEDSILTPTDFVEMSDQALYFSKKNGRNQVTIYTDEIPEKLKNMKEENPGH